MAGGRKTSLTIRLTQAVRQTLLAWQRAPNVSAKVARRGQILLLLADGVPIAHIANVVGLDHKTVRKWIQRFMEQGLAGLQDKPARPGPVRDEPGT